MRRAWHLLVHGWDGCVSPNRSSAALGRLLVAAEAAGKVRTGLKPDEVILALAGLWELDPAGDWQTQAQQLYQLVFAGLRPD